MFLRLSLFRLGMDSRPVFAVLTVTSKCNFRCKYCFADYHARDEKPLSTEQIMHIIDELAGCGIIYLTVHGGEALLRNDIGRILSYALEKDMFVNFITNGSLLKTKWKEVCGVDTLCISLDGRQEHNDSNRGPGTFKIATDAIDFAISQGATVRIGMTVTRHTKDDLEWVARWARDRNIFIHHYLLFDQDSLPEELRMSSDENKEALRKIIALKKKGFPVFYSLRTLEYALNWPFEKHALSRRDLQEIQQPKGFNFIPCNYKLINVLVESNGTLRVCNALARNGRHVSILDRPIMEAKQDLLASDDCLYCYYLPKMEFSNLMALRFEPVLNQFISQLREDIRALAGRTGRKKSGDAG